MTNTLKKITLYDSLSNSKRVFIPQVEGEVSLYVCGVTVYDLTHIGHARVFIFFDIFKKYLQRLGYNVKYVRNHTDVDDKIIRRAAELNEDPLELSQRFIDALDFDMGCLGVDHADVEPKVSTHIDEIIDLIDTLIERGYAYEHEGNVYYRINRFKTYGKLSNCHLDGMEAGRCGRIEASEAEGKEHVFDFALWKSAKSDEISWDSPWGPGRPGWHIECSAMSLKHLGTNFDIHGGGRDLLFPHHENEIAQSEAATNDKFANYWMHVGMVNVLETIEGELVERKMSKSLGNFWTTRDVLAHFHPEAVRYFMCTTSYRQPISYSSESLEEATRRVEYLYTTVARIDETLQKAGFDASSVKNEITYDPPYLQDVIENYDARFDNALADDMNTPRALALIAEIAKISNELTQSKKKPSPSQCDSLFLLRHLLVNSSSILGFLVGSPDEELLNFRSLKAKILGIDQDEIDALIQSRTDARLEKNWTKADEIRDQLLALNVEIMDKPNGETSWRFN